MFVYELDTTLQHWEGELEHGDEGMHLMNGERGTHYLKQSNMRTHEYGLMNIVLGFMNIHSRVGWGMMIN